MKKDLTTKEAIEAITKDIALYLLGLDITDLRFIDKELKRIEKREADLVALCMIEGIEQILHIEIQNDNDPLIDRWMLRYYGDIKSLYESHKVNQYVIYIGSPALKMPDCIKEEALRYHYTLIDMHTIDCEALIRLDTPDALVLAILCDFKGKEAKEVLLYLAQRIGELTKGNLHLQDKYLLMLETLSENRNLKHTLKEVEQMLRTITLEQLPSYEIGMEKGMERGRLEGMEKGKLESARIMVKMGLSPQEVARELGVPLEQIIKPKTTTQPTGES